MKKILLCLTTLTIIVLHSSYTSTGGGDLLQLFWNGKQLHQQHMHLSKEAKVLTVSTSNEKDQLEVLYSHCGQPGTNRTVIFRNEKKEQLGSFHYPDRQHISRMAVAGKALAKMNAKHLYLYYRSNELPNEQLLTVIRLSKETSVAAR